MKKLIILIISIVLFSLCENLFALDMDTHRLINLSVANSTMNGYSLDQYLRNQLSFKQGVGEIFNSHRVDVWLRDGGAYEDAPPGHTIPYRRSRNHFHNPQLPLDQAGYSGLGSFCLVGHCPASAILWALGPQNSDTALGFELNPGGDWSWNEVRSFYRSALTSTATTSRDTNFSNTFRGLGHLMHLVQDMSVPEHTRNDGHAAYAYEEWVRDTPSNNDVQRQAVWTNALANPLFIDLVALGQQSTFGAERAPITNLFDTNQYDGTNPQATLNQNIGLAEYTNANFFSPDTIFSTNYPNPARANTNAQLVESQAEDGVIDRTRYVHLNGQSYKLAAYTYFTANQLLSDQPEGWKYNLDDAVYKDYTALLIPRAVGYSAGLLNYFFRGTLEISAPSTYVYSVVDGSVTPQRFTAIKAKVLNTTQNEAIGNGSLQAVARYKIVPNYAPDLSTYPPDGAIMTGLTYSYSVSASQPVSSLSSSIPAEFNFDFIGSPIPAGITDLTLQVVFKGTLGNEIDTAVAVGMKDLMEPTHLSFWNLTDMFSLAIDENGYDLYTLARLISEINKTDFPELFAALDINANC
jgi:hypothetical protein